MKQNLVLRTKKPEVIRNRVAMLRITLAGGIYKIVVFKTSKEIEMSLNKFIITP